MEAIETRSSGRRRQILDAAREAFATHGFHAASMAEIAAGAGVSVGHIYRYFENKEAVVGAIVEQDLEEAAVKIATLEGDAEAVATQIVRHVGERTSQDKLSLNLEILSEAARNPQVGALVRAADARLREHLRSALASRSGQSPGAALESRVEVVCVLIEGLLTRTVKTDDGDRRDVVEQVRQMLAQTIAG